MVGQVPGTKVDPSFKNSRTLTVCPGLQKIDLGPPIPATAARAKGFDYGLIAILDKAEDLKGYAEHPAHLKYVVRPSKLSIHC